MSAIRTERLENGNLLVSIPITLQFTSNGKTVHTRGATTDNVMREAILLALARGRRWQQYLDDGTVRSVREIAERVGRDESYVARLIRTATLSPRIINEVAAGRLTPQLSLSKFTKQDIPDEWEEHEKIFLK